MHNMTDEVRESRSHRVDKGYGGECWSANIGSGGSSTAGASKKKNFVAPMYSCGPYAILFKSSIPSNSNRIKVHTVNTLCGWMSIWHALIKAFVDCIKLFLLNEYVTNVHN
ncbi:hypothetical protein PIB30_069994 [Stylosanthes scabra]|uniref:Uncharacterized protein n=1 Tax=Stylosanthes scabra TaxID=79078 RepID=A0ABU6ZM44_9FABA|nr:hypothetical protein [Stylosanthes scabra]